ncbi:MAG: hypothetical protein HYW04_11855, partial [Deltaproteobacteria bacterium]|nr:hypothetical protein [Deltaproteobacteria bacterium]
ELLYQAGFKSAEELSEADLESIVEVDGISPDKAEAIYKSSREHVAEKRRKEEEEKAEKAAALAATEAAAAEAAATETGVAEESAEKEPQQA